MNYQITRKIARTVHILIAVVQLLYIYTPIHALPHALLVVQIVTTPLLLVSGIWLTKGHKLWHWRNKHIKEANPCLGANLITG
jgi:hypothetical protein